MKSLFKGRQNMKWILIGILAVSLLFLFTRVRVEGFATNTVEEFHFIRISGTPTAQELEKKISKDILQSQSGKNFKGIKLQRYDKTSKSWMDCDMSKISGQNATFPKALININGTERVLRNCNYDVSKLGKKDPARTDPRFPLPVDDPIFNSDIRLVNLNANQLGITTKNFAIDEKGKNLKIILYFTDDELAKIDRAKCLTA